MLNKCSACNCAIEVFFLIEEDFSFYCGVCGEMWFDDLYEYEQLDRFGFGPVEYDDMFGFRIE